MTFLLGLNIAMSLPKQYMNMYMNAEAARRGRTKHER